MNLAHRIRRYLRAQLGHVTLADEAMLEALEAVVVRREEQTPLAVFREAHRVAIRMTPSLSGGEPMQRALASLPSGCRAAFLLLRLEQFSPAEAGAIMDLSADRVIEEDAAAAVALRAMLVPVGGTAVITERDELTALELSQIADGLGFEVIRATTPNMTRLAGRGAPMLIIMSPADGIEPIRSLADHFDAAVLCITGGSARGLDWPGLRVLHKPFGPMAAAHAMLDAVAEHRCRRLGNSMQWDGWTEPVAGEGS